MANYWYLLLNIPEKLPRVSSRIPTDQANDSAAESWIIANDPQYNPSTSRIFLQRKSTSEADDIGAASITNVGSASDAAVAAGAVGTINAKLRLITSQLNTLLTVGNNAIIAGAPTGASSIQNQGAGAVASPPVGNPLYIGGNDGTNLRAIKTRNDGTVVVDPSGSTTQPTSSLQLPVALTNSGNLKVSLQETTLVSNSVKTTQSTLLIYDPIEGSNVNVNIWNQTFISMASTQGSGLLTLNSGLVVNINTFILIQTLKEVLIFNEYPIAVAMRCKVTPQSNSVIEIGLGKCSGSSTPSDGLFFRWDSTATLKAITNYNGTESQSAAITGLVTTDYYIFQIICYRDRVNFVITDRNNTVISSITLNVPNNQGSLISISHLPVFLRIYNTASSPSVAPQLVLSSLNVEILDLGSNKNWTEQLACIGRNSIQGALNSFIQTSEWTNSTIPSAATLSNATPSYTTLGGQFRFVAVAGAETDYALFAFQVPTGLQLIVEEIIIDTFITGVNNATTATILLWALAINSSGVSLATAENAGISPNTTAPRRLPLGSMGFLQTDVIGTSKRVDNKLSVPLVIDSGKYLHIILRIPVATATPSQEYRGLVTINGYFE